MITREHDKEHILGYRELGQESYWYEVGHDEDGDFCGVSFIINDGDGGVIEGFVDSDGDMGEISLNNCSCIGGSYLSIHQLLYVFNRLNSILERENG